MESILDRLEKLLSRYIGTTMAEISVLLIAILILILTHLKNRRARQKQTDRRIWRVGELCEIEGEYVATCNIYCRESFTVGDRFPVTITPTAAFNHDGAWRLLP